VARPVRSRVGALLLLAGVVTAAAGFAPPPASDTELQAGIAAVAAKDYQAAIGPLSGVVRRLGKDTARQDELLSAYLYLGVAYAGLGQDSPARSQFAQVLLRKPDATLAVPDAPEAARKAFADAKRDAAPALAAAEEQKKKASKKPLLFVGLAGAGAAIGIAGVVGGDDAAVSPPPPADAPPPTSFRFASRNGNPILVLGTGDPGSGSTIDIDSGPRPRLMFTVQASATNPPAPGYEQLRAVVDLVTADRGACWHAESGPFAQPAGTVVSVVVEFPGPTSCAAPFNTLAVEARLFDLVGGRQIGMTTYTGGYRVVP
jgi:hypothetical protein